MTDESRGRLEAAGRASAELLHDLAADLQVLRGWARLVADGVRGGSAAQPDADALEEEAARVGALVSELVDWLAAPRPHGAFAPAERLRAVVQRIDRREGVVPVDLRITVPPTARVAGPATFFDRIAANLLRNAVRHADRQVRVSLDLASRGAAAGVRLRVEDDGAGLDPELSGRLFSPFARGSGSIGHGLGLSSTAWLAEQLAAPPPTATPCALGGARFEVWLPITRTTAEVERGAALSGLRVMLVDDDPAVRRVLLALLRREKAEAEASDFHPALLDEVLDHPPDILLLDRDLGTASGLDLWHRLHAHDPALARRTALLTGGAAVSDPGEGPVVLGKPLDLSALRRFVASAMSARRSTPAARGGARHTRGAGTRHASRAAFREVRHALETADPVGAHAALQRWSAAVDRAGLTGKLLGSLERAAESARAALEQGDIAAARRSVERALGLLDNER